MTKAIVAAAAILALAAGGASAASAQPIPGAAPDDEAQRASKAGDVCEGCHKGYYWTIENWFTGNESYRVYCDPGSCGDCIGGWKPMDVSTYLYWDRQNACALTVSATIREAVQVGAVWTPPELRSRGYGRAVVAASLLIARSEGVETAILFTGEDNVPAQRAYEGLGFRHIGDYRLVLLRAGRAPRLENP